MAGREGGVQNVAVIKVFSAILIDVPLTLNVLTIC